MIVWLDAQLPPSIAAWITDNFGIPTYAVRDLELRDAKDTTIFQAARAAKLEIGASLVEIGDDA